MTAKVYNISLDIVTTPIALCLTEESYTRILNKYKVKPDSLAPGRTSFITRNEELQHIVIYVNVDTTKYCIYDIKGLVVHELNHTLTKVFDYFGFNCDETRSYMLQCLYIKCMKIIDKEIK